MRRAAPVVELPPPETEFQAEELSLADFTSVVRSLDAALQEAGSTLEPLDLEELTALDLLRLLTRQMQLAAIVVTHDLAVARLLAHRMIVMQRGRIVESGLTDQVLDDPQHAYTQLLVSSVLQP